MVSIIGNSTAEGKVTDSVVSVLGNSRATGPVDGAVVAVLGNVYVNGKVGDSVVAVLGNVELGPDADVSDDIVAIGGRVIRDPKATIHGEIHNVSFGGVFSNLDWLHTVGRAADIQVHLVIAEVLRDARGLRQPGRIAAAQLQRQRMFDRLMAQQPRAVAMQHRLRRHHLGIEQCVFRQATMQHPAGTVGPVHHRGHGKTVVHAGLLAPGGALVTYPG